jgi:O-antigen/teichoic acid export membrane protein
LNQDKSPADSEAYDNFGKKSPSNFVTPSIILFIDSLLISAGNWLYWLVISKLTLSSEIGLAVTVYSLVMLVTTLTQLGLEYPLLKKSSVPGSRIVGTSLAVELAITLASIPFIIIVINTLYNESIEHFTWLAIGLLVILSVEFVARFSLLGISNSRAVLIIDLIGLGIKFPIGIFLVYMSQGALGILLAYLLEGLFITFTSLFILRKRFSFHLGSTEYFKETVKDALVNTPSKWSKMVIVTLSIILLAFLNINASDIGIFYISLMITVVAASFASSMAYMVIPSSTTLLKDLSTTGLRISLSLTAPIVVALLVAPRSILSLIGPDYESAEAILFVLALAIIPSSITINLVSKLNNLNKSKFLILGGSVQIATFLICFFTLVPIHGSIGAAISILVAYLSSAILLIAVTDHKSFRYIIYASISVLAGFIVGYMAGMIISHEQQFLILILSVAASIVVIVASKNMTIKETKFLIKEMLQKK